MGPASQLLAQTLNNVGMTFSSVSADPIAQNLTTVVYALITLLVLTGIALLTRHKLHRKLKMPLFVLMIITLLGSAIVVLATAYGLSAESTSQVGQLLPSLPSLGLVISSAFISSINPCTIGVLILLISVILGSNHRRPVRQLLKLGIAYIIGVFIAYVLIGMGLKYAVGGVSAEATRYLSLSVASLIMLAAVLQIKDYFWYGKGPTLSISRNFGDKVFVLTRKFTTVPTVMLLGMFVSAIELPLTGAPYLAVITIMHVDLTLSALLLMMLYSLVFITPLILIVLLVASGTKISKIAKWRQRTKGAVRLIIGVMMATLSWLLILIASGWNN